MGIEHDFVAVSPEIAAQFLKHNTKNRPLNKRSVEVYAKEMREGRFNVNGETIKFAESGRLLDGQHRLHAIIKTGLTFPMLIVKGLDESVFATIDCGKKRTGANVLAIQGEKNYGTLSAAVVFVHRYKHDDLMGYERKYIPAEILEHLKEYGDRLRESVAFVYSIKSHRVLAPSVAAALHYIFALLDEDQANAFWEGVVTGENLSSNSPIYQCREKLVANKAAKAKHNSTHIAGLCIKAWNLYRQGKPCKVLRFTEKEIPQAQ